MGKMCYFPPFLINVIRPDNIVVPIVHMIYQLNILIQTACIWVLFRYCIILLAHTASSVLNFSESCTPDMLAPYLEVIVSRLLTLLRGKNETAEERGIAIYMFKDVVENCREAALRFCNTFAPFLLKRHMLDSLLFMGLGYVQNPVSSVFKPLVFLCAIKVFPVWLSCLPIKGGLIEAKLVHDHLCSMVESRWRTGERGFVELQQLEAVNVGKHQLMKLGKRQILSRGKTSIIFQVETGCV